MKNYKRKHSIAATNGRAKIRTVDGQLVSQPNGVKMTEPIPLKSNSTINKSKGNTHSKKRRANWSKSQLVRLALIKALMGGATPLGIHNFKFLFETRFPSIEEGLQEMEKAAFAFFICTRSSGRKLTVEMIAACLKATLLALSQKSQDTRRLRKSDRTESTVMKAWRAVNSNAFYHGWRTVTIRHFMSSKLSEDPKLPRIRGTLGGIKSLFCRCGSGMSG